MAADISQKLIHKTCEACGDDVCTLAVVPTTDDDRAIFTDKNKDLLSLDPYIAEKLRNK
jgi:hypothetical protein